MSNEYNDKQSYMWRFLWVLGRVDLFGWFHSHSSKHITVRVDRRDIRFAAVSRFNAIT
jgi:hypothetical protein